jgi:hypothetical protein
MIDGIYFSLLIKYLSKIFFYRNRNLFFLRSFYVMESIIWQISFLMSFRMRNWVTNYNHMEQKKPKLGEEFDGKEDVVGYLEILFD